MDYSEVKTMLIVANGVPNGDIPYAPPGAPTIYAGIKGGDAQSALFKPLSGLFSQGKYIPLKYAGPIIIELELVNNIWDPIIRPNILVAAANIRQYFVPDNTSDNWQIENVQVKCDVCTLDNHVENIFTKHMLDGGSFPLRYNNYITSVTTCNNLKCDD